MNITRMFVTFSPELQGQPIRFLVHQGYGIDFHCRCGHHSQWTCEFVFHRFRGSLAQPIAEIGPRLRCVCEDPHITVSSFQSVAGECGYNQAERKRERLGAWHAQPWVSGSIGPGGEIHTRG